MSEHGRVRGSRRGLWWFAVTVGIALLVTECGANGTSKSTSTTGTGAAAENAVSGTSSQRTQVIVVQVTSNPQIGDILTNSSGMTLYHYTKDSTDKSTCTGSCAVLWPPLIWKGPGHPITGPGVKGKIGLIKRANGAEQVTYNGIPLYTYSDDTAAGQVNGQGYRGWWYAVTPSTTSTTTVGANGAGSSSGSGW